MQLKHIRHFFNSLMVKSSEPAGWSGDYKSWQEAMDHCTGYDQQSILEKVKASTLKVMNGEAAFERDSVAFEQFDYSEPLKNALLDISSQKQRLTVIDFGGSLGSLYFQYRRFLDGIDIAWNVVEQEHFVMCGNEYIKDSYLLFYNSLDEALNYGKPDLIILSSVICYLEKPYEWIRKIQDAGAEHIIADRTAFIDDNRERITRQVVPENIYKASYPSWFLNEEKFIASMTGKYRIVNELPDKFDGENYIDGKRCYRKGFYFKLK